MLTLLFHSVKLQKSKKKNSFLTQLTEAKHLSYGNKTLVIKVITTKAVLKNDEY